ncbi:MAG TPA: uracil-DNA glycosylase, partial [Spirochaetota bacterium]|nr:uracil-DNA glycosylase [Spirochaetota bacterium]
PPENRDPRPDEIFSCSPITKMLNAIDINRENVFITNVLKCRPPENRDPRPDEIFSCSPILNEQINIIKPKVILTLGRYSSNYILKTNKGITELRGKLYEMKDYIVVPTFHPAALLRNGSLKKLAWIDLQILRDVLREKGFYK